MATPSTTSTTRAHPKALPAPSDLRFLILAAAPTSTQAQITTQPTQPPPTNNNNTSNATPTTQPQPQPLPQTSPFPAFLEALTGSSPPDNLTIFSGYTSHPELLISNKYFERKVGIWCDEFASDSNSHPTSTTSTTDPEPNETTLSPESDSTPTLSQWTSTMSTPAAIEVRAALGALTLLLPFTLSQLASAPSKDALTQSWLSSIESLDQLCETTEDETGRSLAKIAVLQDVTPVNAQLPRTSSLTDEMVREMEDTTISDKGLFGWDFVLFTAHPSNTSSGEAHADANADAETQGSTACESAKNEFNEARGIPRVLEVLGTIDWTQKLDSNSDVDVDDEDYDYHLTSTEDIEKLLEGVDVDPVAEQGSEFRREIADLHFALEDPRDIAGANDAMGGGEDGEGMQVDQLAGLIDRVVAIREAGAEMGRDERRSFAKSEVAKIMREMG